MSCNCREDIMDFWAHCNPCLTEGDVQEMLNNMEISGVTYSAGDNISIEDRVISVSGISTDDFATKDELSDLAEQLDDKADASALTEINDALDDKLDASAYTPTDLSNYYTKPETDSLLDDKADLSDIPSLDGYATESWVNNQGYLTEHQELKTINNQPITGSGNIEITGETVDAYTKSETDSLLNDKLDITAYTPTDLSNYYNKTEADSLLAAKADATAVTAVNNSLTAHTADSTVHITSSERTAWNAKLDASALDSYSSATEVNAALASKANSSDIPSLNGYATESWVNNQGYLTEHQELKTINNQSIVGSGNITIEGGGSVTVDTELSTTSENPVANSAITTSLNSKATKGTVVAIDERVTALETSISDKQDTLTAGSNITIENNVISATGGGTSYTAGDFIDITSNTISAKIWVGTRSQYNAITTKDNGTIYMVTGDC